MMSIALPLTTSAVTALQKTITFVKYDLPLVMPCWLSPITYLFSMCLSGVSRWLPHDLPSHRDEIDWSVVSQVFLFSHLKNGAPFLFLGFILLYSSKHNPGEDKIYYPEVQDSEFAVWPPHSLKDCELSQSLQQRLLLNFMFLNSLLFMRMRTSKAHLIIGFSITWRRNLS